MQMCIKGAAEDVKLADVGEICRSVDHILLATDGSEPSVAATEMAVMLAKTFGAHVTAIFVDTGYDQLEYPEEAEEDALEGMNPSIKGLAIAKKLCASNDVSCDVRVIQGGVAKRIVATAIERDADLIVVGDTGRTGLRRIALGSVAETVVKGAPVPVLVVKGD